MVVSDQIIDVSSKILLTADAIVASDRVMGNGDRRQHSGHRFRPPQRLFSVEYSINRTAFGRLTEICGRTIVPYVLIGFGRWGSSHPSFGIPVDWSQISGARAIVEATLPGMNVELSQGSHFFHNLSSFRRVISWCNMEARSINWEWLKRQPVVQETEFVRHVRPEATLRYEWTVAPRGVILSIQTRCKREISIETRRQPVRNDPSRPARAGQGTELSLSGR